MTAYQPPRPTRVLAIRAGQLGDTVFASSIIAPLRRRFGDDVVIDWVAKAGPSRLFAADPRIHRVFELRNRKTPLLLNPGKFRLVAESVREPYDIAVNMELGPIFNSTMRLLRARHKLGMPYQYHAEPQGYHAVENLQLIYRELFDADVMREANPSLVGPPISGVLAKYRLRQPYVLLHPTTSHFNKTDYRNYRSWPAEHWRELIRLLSSDRRAQLVLLGARGEEPYFEQLGTLPPDTHSLVGKTSMSELISVIGGAAALVTTDTGPSHIAAAVNTPVFAIFGPSDYHKTGPYSTPSNRVHVVSANLSCSPCSLSGMIRSCPRNRCMFDVTPERVAAAVREYV